MQITGMGIVTIVYHHHETGEKDTKRERECEEKEIVGKKAYE
jgi:hypothetical protein